MKTKQVGSKIKSIREYRNLSVGDLAEQSGLSEEQLKLIESDESLPSLSPLIKIARALGVRLGTFLDGETELGPAICRNGQCSQGIRFAQSSNKKNGHLDFFPLAGQKTGRNMEPFFIDVYKNDNNSQLSSHEGEEFIYVLQGSLNIKYGKDEYALQQGDSIYYDSIIDHLVYNKKDEVCKILAVVYTPF